MPVSRALIPCGGRGTRMMALTRGAAKELIPVAGVPVVIRVLRECAESGIDEVIVIISPEKEEIVEALSPVAGTDGLPRTISFAIQREPRGLADAIRTGREFAAGEPLAVALPDNLFGGTEPGVRQVIDAHLATGKNSVAVVEIMAVEAASRGPTAVYPGRADGDLFHIERVPDKGERGKTFDTGGAASAVTGVGRYVLDNDAFEAIDEVEKTLAAGAELDDVQMMQRLLARDRLVGRRMHGKFYDVGIPEGYFEADREFGNV